MSRRENLLISLYVWLIRSCCIVGAGLAIVSKGWPEGWQIAGWIGAFVLLHELRIQGMMSS